MTGDGRPPPGGATRLRLAALLVSLLAACAGGREDDFAPPILPETGEYRGTEFEWVDTSMSERDYVVDEWGSYVERRAVHFGLLTGGLNFGNCRVGPTGLFLCGEDEVEEELGGIEATGHTWGSVRGEILDEQAIFMQLEYKFWCEGDCDRVFHGIGQWCMIRVHGYLDDDFSCGVPRDDW